MRRCQSHSAIVALGHGELTDIGFLRYHSGHAIVTKYYSGVQLMNPIQLTADVGLHCVLGRRLKNVLAQHAAVNL